MEKIVIEVEDLGKLVEQGSNIVATPDAEAALVKLLQAKIQIEAAIKRASKIIEEKALELNPNFSSIRSDLVKVFYKAYGSKYAIDESKVHFLPKEVLKTKISHTVDTKALETFAKEHNGNLPDGIIVKERKKSISISLVGSNDEDEPTV